MPLHINSRALGATIGLLVSAGCIAFIVARLYEAGQPAPTRVELLNDSGAALSVDGMELGDQPLMRGPLALAASAPWTSPEQPLPPGRPLTVSIAAAGAKASCTLEPRPPGTCVVDAVFKGGAELQCEYRCQGPASAPAQ